MPVLKHEHYILWRNKKNTKFVYSNKINLTLEVCSKKTCIMYYEEEIQKIKKKGETKFVYSNKMNLPL